MKDWGVKIENVQSMETIKIQMVRLMCEVNIRSQENKRNWEKRRQLGIGPLKALKSGESI